MMWQKSIRYQLVFLPLLGLLASCFVFRNLWDDRKLELHNQVLSGTAPTVGQFQLPVHEVVLEGLLRLAPRRSSGWLSLLYVLYYSAGALLLFEALYRLCLRSAGVVASTAACLYYVALMPMFWYDNWYHPSDPWGALISVLLVRQLFNPKPTAAYYGLLLLSGFVWDKSVFFPLSRAASDVLSGRPKGRLVAQFLLGSLLAGFGQFFFRWYYGFRPAGIGSFAQTLSHLHMYFFGLCVVQGPAIYYFLRNYRRLPNEYAGLMLQIPAWLALYVAMNGYIWEYRAIFYVSITYSAPLVAMACQQLLEQPQPVAANEAQEQPERS